jgi:pimeloyl-ACP methyl ester carboxylesterase
VLTARSFVLIPGAWHGGWAWEPVAQRLRSAGHEAIAVTLPGMGDGRDRRYLGLDDAIAHVVTEIEARALDKVVLVAHSFGGIVAASVAARVRERIEQTVYVSAYVPVPGQSMNDGNPPESAAFVTAAIENAPDRSFLPPFHLLAPALMQDLPEAAQDIVYNLLTPAPGRYFLDPYRGPDPASLGARRYICAGHDQGTARPGAELAARLGVEPEWVPGNHEALLVNPGAIAEVLLRP